MIVLKYLKNRSIIVLLFFGCSYLFIYKFSSSSSSSYFFNNLKTDKKLILFWTGTFGSEAELSSWWVTQKNLKKCECSCKYSVNKNDIEKADAVIFHGLQRDTFRYPVPKYRSSEQFWVFFILESPQSWETNFESPNSSKIYYNWTATYRSDSDIFVPYGEFKLRGNVLKSPLLSQYKNKTEMIAWMASKCKTPNRREDIVEKLKNFVNIEIFGKCGTNKCPEDRHTCFTKFSQKYKFYLSFENSVCEDYVTEKFYTPLKYGMVPIVYGGANYSKISPPQSYINVGDFESIESLGKYLQYLDQNHGEYEKYFEWTKTHTVDNSGAYYRGICGICKKLHENPRKRKFYENLDKWWSTSQFDEDLQACSNPYDNDNVQVLKKSK